MMDGSEEGKVRISQRFSEKCIPLLPAVILVFCILQPLLDVAGFWQDYYQIGNTVTLVMRMLLLAGSVGLGFLLSDRKKYYLLLFAVLAVLTLLHVAANLPGGYESPTEDVLNLFRIYLMPMTVFCLITFLRRGGEPAFRALKTGLFANFLIIAGVELLSVLTRTDPKTYTDDQIGVFGWFLWGNCQSAILSMLSPLVICWGLNRWRKKLLPIALLTAMAEAVLYFFGSRLSFGAMVAAGCGMSACLLLVDRFRWKQALTIFLVTAIFACAFPVSPLASRMRAVEARFTEKDQMIHARETAPSSTESTGEQEDLSEIKPENREQMAWIYKNYFAGVVKRFGLRRVMEKYNYTTDVEILGNDRLHKLYFCEMVMEDSSFLCHLFGVSLADLRVFMPNGIYNEKTDSWEDGFANYDVENDFHGVYFLLGWVGLGLMIAFLLYFGIRVLGGILRERKACFTVELAAFLGAYGLGLIHAWFTVSVLRRNNASVYLAIVLAGLWYLTRKNPGLREKGAAHGASESCKARI